MPVASVDGAGSAASAPTDGYVPHRVWQMKKNCVWAAGAMLIDKWTHGGTRVSQGVLRRASNDKKGGSSLYDLARGVAAVTGIRMSFSPGYGDTMAWWQFLDRLDHGGGAVLIGEYSKFPPTTRAGSRPSRIGATAAMRSMSRATTGSGAGSG